ncbi:hypothetical protein ACFX10_019403 [Malus domestica]
MPMEEYFSKALYTFDIGQNDLGEGFSDKKTIHEVNASVPDIVSMFSTNIKATIQLRKDLPLAAFTYVDTYSVKYSLYKEHIKYGFELPLVACCGYGGNYNYSNSVECGATVKVNGSQIFVGSCKRPSARVIWDGIHYAEAAAKFVFDKISTGEFSDPPLPFKQACHRIILD